MINELFIQLPLILCSSDLCTSETYPTFRLKAVTKMYYRFIHDGYHFGQGTVLATDPSPKNRMGDFPGIRLRPSRCVIMEDPEPQMAREVLYALNSNQILI